MGACAFDLAHYLELLDAVQAGGYRWARFDHEPAVGDLLLRHDVDLSLAAALQLAELEHERGATATYFLMTHSVFYNLSSRAGRHALERLRELGHAVGLHATHPHVALDDRFDPVVAWHNPDPEYISEPIPGVVNVMQPPWFTQGQYRSDSNQHWREGCPHEELREGKFEWLQLLVHPEIWVYSGSTMRETMDAMLEAKQQEWVDALVDDRIDMT